MRIVVFCHSLVSDWNHGNAHFLRGICSEWTRQGHFVSVFEPEDGWSYQNVMTEYGGTVLEQFRTAYPELSSTRYNRKTVNLRNILSGADLVLVHEWNEQALINQIGEHHKAHPTYNLFFHDTHHRAASAPHEMEELDLSGYDGVLAFGNVIRDIYIRKGWAKKGYTWHEAADPHIFSPRENRPKEGDLVWIGNWGDEERTSELREFLIKPVARLGLKAVVYGVRYPELAQEQLRAAGIEYRGWLPNFQAPDIFSRFSMTIHVPRRLYSTTLPGVPTIRVFEALASGIPLISAPWNDSENLFEPGVDFLVARDGKEMEQQMSRILAQPDRAYAMAARGRATILARHTCAHRVDQLLGIIQSQGPLRLPRAAMQ